MAAWRYEISLLVLKNIFTRSLGSLVKFFSHSKRNLVFPRGHVLRFLVEYDTREVW